MPDISKPAAAALPDFNPVPRKCRRHDGWTQRRQRDFIEKLAEYGSVRAAANAVGMTPESAYYLRRHPQAESFRAAWQAALDFGMQRVEDVAMDRALNGVDVPVYSYGKLVGTRTVYNDRLLMFLLRNRAPDRFTGGRAKSLNAVDKAALIRLKQEWRAEWEREYAIAQALEDDAQGDSFIEDLQAMHRNWYLALSPATRAAYRAFREAEAAGRHTRTAPTDAEPDPDHPEHDPQTCHRPETLAQAEAEYEELFGKGHDHRAQSAKLLDMRVWEGN